MLSKRINELFQLLQCTSTDIANFADCSPSNISRLKSGSREPDPGSRSIERLAQGIYRYADYENMLNVLCSLCGTEKTAAEDLIPAIIAWLYGDQAYKLPQPVTPKSKKEKINRLQSFSDKLDKIMTVLNYSNSRLAADLNVDSSLISRYRSGIYHPNRNVEIKRHLAELILTRAEDRNQMTELAAFCSMDPKELNPETFAEWLYEPDERQNSEIAESIFHSIDSFKAVLGNPANVPELPTIQIADRYWGTEGLRNAVIRFLAAAARESGEMLLYSDEPMDWMIRDPKYFTLWASLMTACLQKGVHIRIIHNIDRDSPEMFSAIKGWLPLYISGNIEPYIFRKPKNSRFHHTVFLRPGRSCILGFFPAGMGSQRWYDYIIGKDQLEAIKSGFSGMLDNAVPFLKTVPAHEANSLWKRYYDFTGKADAILRGLSFTTMPEKLLSSMLGRQEITAEKKKEIINFYHRSTKHFHQILEKGELREFICLPDREDVIRGKVNINFEAETDGLVLPYSPEEYAEHLAAVRELVKNEKNYHLTLLPQAPFQDLQVFTMKDTVAVTRNQKPYTVFAFYNPELLQSVNYYCDMLASQYASDRMTTIQMLDKIMKS